MRIRASAAVIAAIGCLLVASPASGQGQSPASSAAKKEEAANAAAAREAGGRSQDVVKVGALINDVQQLDQPGCRSSARTRTRTSASWSTSPTTTRSRSART